MAKKRRTMKIFLKKLWHDLLWVLGYKAKWKK